MTKVKKLRKLRVLTREYKHKLGQEKTMQIMKRKSINAFNLMVLINKIERIEGNDIVSMLNRMLKERTLPPKEIHVTGRIAKKILAADSVHDNWNGDTGIITTIRGTTIRCNNDSFNEFVEETNHPWEHRSNPTGEREWMHEIKFIEE